MRQIRAADFSTFDFASALEFLRAREQGLAVDCLIADVHLQMMDGLQLQEDLQSTAPHLPIIFITGDAELSIGMQAMRRVRRIFSKSRSTTTPCSKQFVAVSNSGTSGSRQKRSSRSSKDDMILLRLVSKMYSPSSVGGY